MNGTMLVSYKVLCDGDLNEEITLSQILSNEKVLKAIKSEFAKGARNISLSAKSEGVLLIETQKELQTLEVAKDDFADLLSLAEEDATNKKLFKKECSRIELIDIETV